MVCPLLSICCMKPGINEEQQEYVECQEEKCMFYIQRSARTEVYTCAIPALAIYNLPNYKQER